MTRLHAVVAGRTLALERGAAAVLDGPDAEAVVKALTGDDRRRGHRVVLDGRDLSRLPPAARVRRGLVTVAAAPVAPDVSVRDHLAAVGRGAVRLLADAPLLADRGGDPAGVLSGGERRVLAWLVAVALGPAAVVLDRAGEGLDPDSLAWAGRQVRRWRQAGVVVVVRPGRGEERVWAAAWSEQHGP